MDAILEGLINTLPLRDPSGVITGDLPLPSLNEAGKIFNARCTFRFQEGMPPAEDVTTLLRESIKVWWFTAMLIRQGSRNPNDPILRWWDQREVTAMWAARSKLVGDVFAPVNGIGQLDANKSMFTIFSDIWTPDGRTAPVDNGVIKAGAVLPTYKSSLTVTEYTSVSQALAMFWLWCDMRDAMLMGIEMVLPRQQPKPENESGARQGTNGHNSGVDPSTLPPLDIPERRSGSGKDNGKEGDAVPNERGIYYSPYWNSLKGLEDSIADDTWVVWRIAKIRYIATDKVDDEGNNVRAWEFYSFQRNDVVCGKADFQFWVDNVYLDPIRDALPPNPVVKKNEQTQMVGDFLLWCTVVGKPGKDGKRRLVFRPQRLDQYTEGVAIQLRGK